MSDFRSTRALVAALVLALVVGWVGHAAMAAPQQDDPPAPLEVSLNSLTPVVPKLKGKLTLSGTVTNTTESELSSLSVSMRLGERPITDRNELAEISSEAFSPFTRGVLNGSVAIPRIAAGATLPWTVTVPMKDLQLEASGVYFLRVDAVADFDNTFSASTQTFLPWFPDPDLVIPTEVAWLWPLSDWPDRNAANVFLTDRTPTEIAADGRLDRLLTLGLSAGRKIDWVIDPQVLESASVIAGGYQVMGINGDPVDGGSAEPAVSWLARARTGLVNASIYDWAYANPDVTALAQAGMGEDVTAATTIAPELLRTQLGRPATASLGWPTGTRTDRESLGILQRAGVRAVVLKSTALQPPTDGSSGTDPTALIRTEARPLPAVLTDPVLSGSLGSADDTAAQALIARQRFLAEAGVLAGAPGTTGTSVVVGPDSSWNPSPTTVAGILEAVADAPWLTATSLATVISKTSTDFSRSLEPVSSETKRALRRAKYLKDVAATQKKLRLFGSIVQSPDALTQPYATALLRTTSGAWRSKVKEGTQLLEVIADELDTDIAKVRVISGGVINISSGSGEIPITISNDLSVPVTVGLELIGTPKVRLVSDEFTAIPIPANRKVSTEINAQVIGNGELSVAVQLTNTDGDAYGKPAEVILRSTAYAQAASWVVGIAFLLLTALLAVNSIRRRHQAKVDRAAANGDEGDSADNGPDNQPAGSGPNQ